MSKVMHITVTIELPDDEWNEAAQKVALKPAWDAFATALTEAGIQFKGSMDTVSVRAKRAKTATSTTRGRRPRIAAVQGADVPPEAA